MHAFCLAWSGGCFYVYLSRLRGLQWARACCFLLTDAKLDAERKATKSKINKKKAIGIFVYWLNWCPGPDLNRHEGHPSRDFKSLASTNFATRAGYNYWGLVEPFEMEARVGIEPTMAELQSTALPLCYRAKLALKRFRLPVRWPTSFHQLRAPGLQCAALPLCHRAC